jgi:Fe-S cluster assembly iron-binding protein IscA
MQIALAKKQASFSAVEPGHALRISVGNMGCEGIAYNMSRNKLLLAADCFAGRNAGIPHWTDRKAIT